MSQLPLILILSSGDSCRGPMAAGFLAREVGDLYEVASAGIRADGQIHPLTLRVMGERRVDLDRARSQPLYEFEDQRVQVVITVSSDADENCPVYPGQLARHHIPFQDPTHAGAEKEALARFRAVRDDIERVMTIYGRGLRDGAALGRPRFVD